MKKGLKSGLLKSVGPNLEFYTKKQSLEFMIPAFHDYPLKPNTRNAGTSCTSKNLEKPNKWKQNVWEKGGEGRGVDCPHSLGPSRSEGHALHTCKSFGEVREQMARVMVYSS